MENLDKHVDTDQERKFAGLYVSVGRDGTVVAPKEAIDPEWARAVTDVLGTFIRSMRTPGKGSTFMTSIGRPWKVLVRWSKRFERVTPPLSRPRGAPRLRENPVWASNSQCRGFPR